jgi:hypothetical protein
LGKGVDPGQRQSRDGKIDVRDPKIIRHINGCKKQGISSLDRVGSATQINWSASSRRSMRVESASLAWAITRSTVGPLTAQAGKSGNDAVYPSSPSLFTVAMKVAISVSQGSGENESPVSASRLLTRAEAEVATLCTFYCC